MCFYATSGPAFLLSWQRWRCRSPIVLVCVKIKVENLLYRFPLKYLCIVYYVSVFSFTAHLYYFIRRTFQSAPTYSACMATFRATASACRFSASSLTQSYLPNNRRVTRQGDASCGAGRWEVCHFHLLFNAVVITATNNPHFDRSSFIPPLIVTVCWLRIELPIRASFYKFRSAPFHVTLYRLHILAGASEVLLPSVLPLVTYT